MQGPSLNPFEGFCLPHLSHAFAVAFVSVFLQRHWLVMLPAYALV